jgi:hypothetical protein
MWRNQLENMVLTMAEAINFLKQSPKLSEKYECPNFKIPSSVCVSSQKFMKFWCKYS